MINSIAPGKLTVALYDIPTETTLVTEKSGCLANTMSGNVLKDQGQWAEIASMLEWNVDCPRLFEVSVHVNEKVLICIIDSGATHSFICASVV